MSKLRQALTVDDWDLIVTDHETGRSVTLHPEQRDRFWADPFIWFDPSGDMRILCEEFDYRTNLGTVVELVLDASMKVTSVTPTLGTAGHESYPFAFDHEGITYCIPETAHLGEVSLYRHNGLDWERERTLLEGFAGLDTTLLVDPAGDLWLFSTPLNDPHSLHVWHGADLDGSWTPHRLNPVVSSVRGGRQAGRIRRLDDVVVRPGQNSSTRYGGSIVQFDVCDLSLGRYREQERGEIHPPEGYSGIHTVDDVGRFQVVDAARRTPVIAHPSFLAWRFDKSVGRQ